jgi:hypothetical protein
VRVQHVRLLGERDRLAREPLALIELGAPCEHLAARLAPQHLRETFVARGGLAPALEPLLCLVVSTEPKECPGKVARKMAAFAVRGANPLREVEIPASPIRI